ncbi:hypothetical protein DFH09DRAFT_1390810 [Mycena vulgaris]|nr:hypothetical protein DFH09DRAFT_1390810 [Mycena vulgaris]
MFTAGKSVFAYAALVLALAAQSSAHAIPSPALGVKGAPARSDVQRPSTAKPCGTIDPATTLDTSTAVAAAADGSVSLNVVNFNAGADGSTSVSVQVDASGKGTAFVAGTVTTNGNPAPKAVETDKVVFTLPAGTKCAGGAAGNLCLVSVKTTAGFGACMVVSQGAASAAGGAVAATTAVAAGGAVAATTAAPAAVTTAAAATGKGKGAGRKGKGKAGKAAAAGAVAGGAAPAAVAAKVHTPKGKKVGTRAPRALRRELFDAEVERRGSALD